ncbi:chemotaxis protein CheW [Thiomicrorhabdus sp. ZW0627]|uniref:chemotaxis protein CheW n=1 Tax=Thiomicrorhabdus sp. ZW0627 TaxID=3039774 RepID=UPI002436526F|nr:chemotaxis protein CheW [Thiomicrorhabdus sp. ZW0627]MDG6773322.1 chemotaxis protein CheW [Thiomicrorhabdus sp. ZW0627]
MNEGIQQELAENRASSVSGLDEDSSYMGPSARCVLFTLEDEIYGIHVKKIREVLRVGKIRKVAGTSSSVLGVINVRGVIVTVLDTRIVYGMQPKPVTDLSRIIIVELDDEQTVGMMVDFVMEVKDIPESKLEPLSSTKDNASRYIQGIAHYQGNVIILIDVDSMLKELI